MKESWLIQRLGPAPTSDLEARGSQVFGGGMLMLSKEAWKICQQAFNFDYMGAAEYEFGTIPNKLREMAEFRGELVAFSFILKKNEIKPNFSREMAYRDARRKELAAAKAAGKRAKRAKKVLPALEERTVYVLCRKQDREEVERRIRLLALEELRVRDWTAFAQALDPCDEHDSRRIGWLELDNGFFFFIDKDAWEKTCAIFQVEVPRVEAAKTG